MRCDTVLKYSTFTGDKWNSVKLVIMMDVLTGIVVHLSLNFSILNYHMTSYKKKQACKFTKWPLIRVNICLCKFSGHRYTGSELCDG